VFSPHGEKGSIPDEGHDMGGNLMNYPDDVGTPAANLLLIKIFLNSVISTPGAKFATADLANFFLMTPLK
jgi:hypothetical protein